MRMDLRVECLTAFLMLAVVSSYGGNAQDTRCGACARLANG
jgi:hypothetical protein